LTLNYFPVELIIADLSPATNYTLFGSLKNSLGGNDIGQIKSSPPKLMQILRTLKKLASLVMV